MPEEFEFLLAAHKTLKKRMPKTPPSPTLQASSPERVEFFPMVTSPEEQAEVKVIMCRKPPANEAQPTTTPGTKTPFSDQTPTSK